MLIQTIIEIVIVAALIVGLFHEDKLADIEEKVISKIKGRLKR